MIFVITVTTQAFQLNLVSDCIDDREDKTEDEGRGEKK